MSETKYFVTVDNKTVAENIPLEYAWILTKGIFEHFYNEHDMVVAIAEMPEVIFS